MGLTERERILALPCTCTSYGAVRSLAPHEMSHALALKPGQ